MRATIAAAAGLMLMLPACAGSEGRHPAAPNATATATAISQAQRTHEYPSPSPLSETTSGGGDDAVAAVRIFAGTYINWSYDTVSDRLRGLARESVGQARSAMELAATQTAGDYELQRGGVSNRGTVEAVVPRLSHRNQYVVVTRELTTATATNQYQGLRPAWHLAIATVTQLASGQWVVSGWQPEN